MAVRGPYVSRWHHSLMLRFVLLGMTCWLLFTAASGLLREQVGTDLEDQNRERVRRMSLEFDLITQSARTLASSIVLVAVNPNESLQNLRAKTPDLIERQADTDLFAAVGVWPLPNTLDPARERASLVWLSDGAGRFQLREDYNDPRIVPYTREKWFTPARYSPQDRCYWTPAYQDPLSHRAVSTCAMPIRTAQGFVGVITISLDLDAVAKKMQGVAGAGRGYGLLTTLSGDVVLTTGSLNDKLRSIRNLAELARENPGFSTLALQIHREHESIIHAVAPNATQISALKNDSREMSQEEAVSALVSLALTAPAGGIQPSIRQVAIANETALGAANAAVFSLPGQWWMFVAITPADTVLSALPWLSVDVLILSGSMLGLVLLMLWGMRLWVLQPLQAMTAQISAAASVRDAYHTLGDASQSELGMLAYWHNESLRLLQQEVLHMRGAQSQVANEQDSRRDNKDAMQKARERSALALQSVSDGVIIFNEQAQVVEMNLAAEKLTGLSAQAALGKAFDAVFKTRPAKDASEPAPVLSEIALRQKTPMEYPQPLKLLSAQGETQDIYLSFYPLQSRSGAGGGCIAVFRRLSAGSAAQAQQPTRRMLDGMTGLPMRGACEDDLRTLINEAKLLPQKHALLFIDIDDLKRINDTKGQQAGDEVIAQIAGILIGIASKDGNNAYRLYGDQFAIVMKATDLQHAMIFAEKLCARFSSSALRGQASSSRITISVGVCLLDGVAPNPAELIRRCELACSSAKRAGRNRALEWAPALEETKKQADDAQWLKRIRAGLDQDMFHLTTQFMPATPAVAAEGPAYQMLMALEDEEGFWSTTSAFMPTAQRHDLTYEMDRWLINRSMTQLQQSPATLKNISFVGIQLSETAISDNRLLEYLMKLFTEQPSVPATKFCFEFSEYALQKSPQQALMFCEVMRKLGCHLCIDGFVGRRTSDIAQLRKLPIDFIRIDAAQFPNIENDSVELMLTESLMRLARTLNKRIIVCNLETPAQMQAWQKLGPDYLLGSAVAKPSPVIFSSPR